MSHIRRRLEALADKHMAQMAAALLAQRLREHPVRPARHRAVHGIIVRRPAAAGIELLLRLVQRRRTARARVHAVLRVVLVVGAGVGRLGGL